MAQQVPADNPRLRGVWKAVSSSLFWHKRKVRNEDSADSQEVYQSLSQGEKTLQKDGERSRGCCHISDYWYSGETWSSRIPASKMRPVKIQSG